MRDFVFSLLCVLGWANISGSIFSLNLNLPLRPVSYTTLRGDTNPLNYNHFIPMPYINKSLRRTYWQCSSVTHSSVFLGQIFAVGCFLSRTSVIARFVSSQLWPKVAKLGQVLFGRVSFLSWWDDFDALSKSFRLCAGGREWNASAYPAALSWLGRDDSLHTQSWYEFNWFQSPSPTCDRRTPNLRALIAYFKWKSLSAFSAW